MRGSFRNLHFSCRLIASLLSICLLVAMVPSGLFCLASAEAAEVSFATISDIHYLDAESMGNMDEGFTTVVDATSEQLLQIDGLLDAALASAAQNGMKYVLIPGDISFNGQLSAHKAVAAKLKAFEEETGIQVFVINGNHDINYAKAEAYVLNEDTGEYYWEKTDSTTPEDFLEIYADLGYDKAYHTYTPEAGWAGSLSYSAQLEGGLRLIAIDAGKYSSDSTASGLNKGETAGAISDGLMKWVLAEIADAKQAGEIPIAMTHWNLSSMNYFQTVVLQGFAMDNYIEVSEALADAGLHYVFTGHSHANDISSITTDNGEVLYSIMTGSLCSFPNYYRENSFSIDEAGSVTTTFNVVECDSAMQISDLNGVRYNRPYVRSSFNMMFSDGDASALAMKMLTPMLTNLLNDVREAGLIKYIEGKIGIDLERMFDDMLHGGLLINNQDILTAKNIMAVLADIEKQITVKYIDDPEYTLSLVEELVSSFLSIEASQYPCTKFASKYGFSSSENGTLGDALISVMIYMYEGNEDAEGDIFIQDVLSRFESGELVRAIINWARESLINNLIINEFLASIQLNLSSIVVADSATDLKQLLMNIDSANLKTWINDYFGAIIEEKGIDFSVLTENGRIILENIDNILGLFGKNGISPYLDLLTSMIGSSGDLYNLLASLLGLNPNGLIIDKSFKGLLELVLSYGVAGKYGKSVDEIIDYLLLHYISDSQCEGIGYQCALLAGSLINDNDPKPQGDYDVSYVYSGPVEVVPTREDYRLPTIITTSFGNDACTEFNISWYSKYSLEATDIELIKADELPKFKGVATVADNIETNCEEVVRQYFGVDLGVAGILPYKFTMLHHMVNITGLEPDSTYYYRVGNAEKGWWSEIGRIKTAKGNGAFTFLHMTDSQSQTKAQYERSWAKVVDTAYDMFPDSRFILHTGDIVDHGNNVNHWQWAMDTAAEHIMNSAIMPVSGNHEGFGNFAISDNFNLNIANPERQDTEDGVYYSFDYNNAHFAILNTNSLSSDGSLTKEQLLWLTEDMNSSDAQWKFVALHKAVYSNGEHYNDKEIVGLRAQLAKLMPELNIDIVFQGHDHVYLRTDALNNNKIFSYNKDVLQGHGLVVDALVNPDGTIYVISGASGVKSYIQNEKTEMDAFAAKTLAVSDPMFSAIVIDGDVLYFKAYSVAADGTTKEVDSFGLAKYDDYYMVGDVNLNGKVTAADAREALRAAAKLERILGKSFAAADVDEDGKVTPADARRILRVAAKLDSFVPEFKLYYENGVNPAA